MKNTYRFLLIFFTILCYLSVFISPEYFWPMGFLALAIPFVLLYHLVVSAIKLRKPGISLALHLFLFLLGFPFLRMTFQISSSGEAADTFSVLSYNVRVFNNYAHLNDNNRSSKDMIRWTLLNDADIKCFQEFYNKPGSEVFDVKSALQQAGWKQVKYKTRFTDRKGGEFGMAIFSRYPIVKSGDVNDGQGNFMNAIFADVTIKTDTVRIYCMHLESMSIDETIVTDTEKFKKSFKETGYRLKGGFKARARQVKFLEEHILTSPHRVIVCGDMNELPYSFAYVKLRGNLYNAFEKKGAGFGFSYNGKLFFLRIDHQFYSKALHLIDFDTHREAKQSDHFPISAVYSFR